MITEPTSSVFILRRDRVRGWMTALVWHPRLECWLPAGGHVETDETAAQCGIREALEETGLDITLVPGPAVPVPAGFPHRRVPAPWLVAEVPAAPDRHTGERHLHADHVYVAVAGSSRPVREPEHQVRWFTQADIATAPAVSEDSRILAARLLAVAAPQPGPGFQWPPEPGHGTATGRPRVIAEAAISARPGSGCLPRLIVIRGNSASGKSAAAAAIRDRHGSRDLAIVSLTDRWRRLMRSD